MLSQYPLSAFHRGSPGSPGGVQQQFATQTLRVHVLGLEKHEGQGVLQQGRGDSRISISNALTLLSSKENVNLLNSTHPKTVALKMMIETLFRVSPSTVGRAIGKTAGP